MYLWLVITGGIACLYNSWGVGANDCANYFATSVDSGALTLKQAVITASIFEFLGAFLMGSQVTSAIRKNIVNVEIFESDPSILMLGMLCSNISAGLWLHIASYLKLPVSTTHSIIGSIIGFSLVYGGEWNKCFWSFKNNIILGYFSRPVGFIFFDNLFFFKIFCF